MKETLAEIIPEVVRILLSGVHTALPGKIDKYDQNTFRATVTPLVGAVTANNTEVMIPPVEDVPILLQIDVELEKGDNVLLIFCESEIGGWKSSDGSKQIFPEDLTHHKLNNAVAIPILYPDGKQSGFKKFSAIKLAKDGTVTINDHFKVLP